MKGEGISMALPALTLNLIHLSFHTQGNGRPARGPGPGEAPQQGWESRSPSFLASVSTPRASLHASSCGFLHFPRYLDVLGHHADVPAGGQEPVDGAGQVGAEPLTEEVSP